MYTKTGQTIDEINTEELGKIAKNCWEISVINENCNLNIEDEIKIDADTEFLRHLLENLFKNAVENNATNIWIGKLKNGFYIEDDGSGIPKEERKKVFDINYSNKGDTGLGLALIEQIVRGHNWDIDIKESKYGSARFEIITD